MGQGAKKAVKAIETAERLFFNRCQDMLNLLKAVCTKNLDYKKQYNPANIPALCI